MSETVDLDGRIGATVFAMNVADLEQIERINRLILVAESAQWGRSVDDETPFKQNDEGDNGGKRSARRLDRVIEVLTIARYTGLLGIAAAVRAHIMDDDPRDPDHDAEAYEVRQRDSEATNRTRRGWATGEISDRTVLAYQPDSLHGRALERLHAYESRASFLTLEYELRQPEGPPISVRDTLADLVAAGAVSTETIGATMYYRLNTSARAIVSAWLDMWQLVRDMPDSGAPAETLPQIAARTGMYYTEAEKLVDLAVDAGAIQAFEEDGDLWYRLPQPDA